MGLLDNTTHAQYYQDNDYGNYQFTSLEHIINQFMVGYVGEDKVISKIKRTDVQFHAMRALQELSFDTFKSCKSQEIEVPATLQMILPQDYVNYTKVSWVDSSGIKHLLYPTSKTSNPFKPQVDSDGDYLFDNNELIASGNLLTNGNFMGGGDAWDLNVHRFTGDTLTNVVLMGHNASNPITTSVGWFARNNSIISYNTPTGQSFAQRNLSILNGEEYTITYTISGYSSGGFQVLIIDQEHDYTFGTERTANGTYTETLTAGESLGWNAIVKSSLVFRSTGTGGSGNATIDNISIIRVGDDETSTAWSNYKSSGLNLTSVDNSLNTNPAVDADNYFQNTGKRYGLDGQYAQANGSFYIDCNVNKIHFSSNISGKTIVLDYISDSLGTDGEMQVHKFAEEAMYKWIVHAILSTRTNTPEYVVSRFKKERFAAIRNAKLRLSNIKLEEITQVLRSKSKWIKH